MTYNERQASEEGGSPVLLVTFVLGTFTWRFVRGEADVPHGGHTYTAASMKPSDVSESSERDKNDVQLVVDRTFPIAELWRVSPPTSTMAVVLKELHRGDGESVTAWLGHVGNVRWNRTRGEAVLTLSSGANAMDSNGLRRLVQKGCPHDLYGPKCQKDRSEAQHAVTLATIVRTVLTGAAFATAGAKFAGGYIEWVDGDGITDRRFIVAHTPGTNTVVIMGQAPLLAPGTVVQAFEGCDHTTTRCDELGNIANHGGFPGFLGRNPYAQSSNIYN